MILPARLLSPIAPAILAATAIAFTASAQTASPTHTPVHHTATTTHHAVVRSAACPVPAPVLSPKIPALPATLPKCPTLAYALTWTDTVIGTGALAEPHKYYTVHYTGYLTDGTKFDSSLDRKEPITFPYGAHRVIPGWDTGFTGMHLGGKRRLYVPYQLAYGETGRPPVIPAKAELIFDIELISQSDTPPTPKTPPTLPTAKPGTPGAPAPAPATPPASPRGTEQPPKTSPQAASPAAAPANPTSPAGASAPPPITSSTPATSTSPNPKPQPQP